MVYKINIIQIDKHKQKCIDSSGKIYTLQQIMQCTQSANVHAVKCNGRYEIRWKKNCKPSQNTTSALNKDVTQKEEHYTYGNQVYDIYFISEDKSSALNIIRNIINKYAENEKITIRCKYVIAKGFGNIINCIENAIPYNAKCIVMYDIALNDMNTLKNIESTIQLLSVNRKIQFIRFVPNCAEECALSFEKLQQEIIGITNQNMQILKYISNYRLVGNAAFNYNNGNNSSGLHIYSFGNTIVQLTGTEMSKYFKDKQINNLERLLAEILADITHGKPYEFKKRANQCWIYDCKHNCGNNDTCILEKELGKYRPNSNVQKCNKTLLNTDKTQSIIDYSLFGIIYEILNIIIKGNTKLNKDVIKCFIRFN